MRKPVFSLYLALVVATASSVAFFSLLQLFFRFEREEIINQGVPITFAAKIEPGMGEDFYGRISDLISMVDGIVSTQFVFKVPPWHGEPEKEDEWNDLWKAYLSPIVFATSEYHVRELEEIQQIAENIDAVTGVSALVWDQNMQQEKKSVLTGLHQRQTYYTTVFCFFLLGTILSLIYSYPLRLKRKYVVRTGVGGAGSQVNPEKVWFQIIGYHAGLAMIVFFLLFSIGYNLLPFTLYPRGAPGFTSLLFQGLFVVGALTAGTCLIGWWLPAEEIHEIQITRPPMADWR
ncbi:hypothetical protein GF373_10210 [bacterium]|nr:hypothetical protein [bacterium]